MNPDIVANNMLIAAFDGKEQDGKWFRGFDLFIHSQPSAHCEQLKYNSSWDWLMPVIAKIKKLLIGCVADGSFRLEGRIERSLCAIDLEATHKAVVEFIKWRATI